MFFNPSTSCSSASPCLAMERAPGGLHLGRLHIKEDVNPVKKCPEKSSKESSSICLGG